MNRSNYFFSLRMSENYHFLIEKYRNQLIAIKYNENWENSEISLRLKRGPRSRVRMQ